MPKGLLKKIQKYRNNAGWRIELIPFGKPGRATGVVGFLLNVTAIIALGSLLAGAFLSLRTDDPRYMILFAIGAILILLTHLFQEKARRANWAYVTAVCRDIEKDRYQMNKPGVIAGGYVWDFRCVCSFEFGGKTYTVTPFHRRTYSSESDLDAFLEKAIDPKSACVLRVNPKNPLEADFTGRIPESKCSGKEGR